jgi:hypothetical protein
VLATTVGIGILACGTLTAAALAGASSHRITSRVAAQHAVPTTQAAPTTVLVPTTVIVTTTEPPTTTTTVRPKLVPATTAPPTTVPLTTLAPSPTVPVGPALSLSPVSTAGFPTTPPPYWPMPIVPVTVTNTGGVTINAVVVHPVGVYSVPSSTCSALAPGQSCTAQVQFCPSSPGHYVNTLSVTGLVAASGSPINASLTLDGTAT